MIKSLYLNKKKKKKIVLKGYVTYDMFKLNLKMNKKLSSGYVLSSFNIQYARLCHVNKKK